MYVCEHMYIVDPFLLYRRFYSCVQLFTCTNLSITVYVMYVAIYSSIEYVITCVQTMSLHSCIGDVVIVMIRTDLTDDRKGVLTRID